MDQGDKNQAQNLLSQVQAEFSRRGLLGRTLILVCEGQKYSVRCDDGCFTVYCVNPNSHIPPGLPGYMVCRVAEEDIFGVNIEKPHTGQGRSKQAADCQLQAGAWASMVLKQLDDYLIKE